VNGWADFPLQSIADVIDRTVLIGRLTNPRIRCIGVSLNTSQVPPAERDSLLARYAEETGLRCVDPLIDGVDPLVGALLDEFPR
jgi:uncharacterized NAD-dependent epimerase/dehydratase family protein